jgi:hypothetical protein
MSAHDTPGHSHLLDDLKIAVDADIEIHLGKLEDLFAYGAVRHLGVTKGMNTSERNLMLVTHTILIQRLFERLADSDVGGATLLMKTLDEVISCRVGRMLISEITQILDLGHDKE